MVPGRVEAAHDLPPCVDADGLSYIRSLAGSIVVNAPLSSRKPCTHAAAVRVAAHDLAASIDTEGLRGCRTRGVDRGKGALV